MQETVHASEGIHPGFETQVDVNGLTRRSNVLQKKCETLAGSQIELYRRKSTLSRKHNTELQNAKSARNAEEYFAVTVNVFIKDTGRLETFSA